MGFNFGAFLGGGARGGSRAVERFSQNNRDDKVTKEARQWQIATEARADSRSRKKARASKKRDNETLLASLSFHYGEDNATTFMGRGQGYAAEALKKADLYVKAGFEPSVMVESTVGQNLPDVPTASSPQGLSQGTGVGGISFKPIPPKAVKSHTTYQARLVAANDKIINAQTDADKAAAQTEFNIVNEAHKKFISATESETGISDGQLDFSKTTRDKLLQDPITNAFKNAGLYKTSVGGQLQLTFDGNQGQVFGIMDSIITQNTNAFSEVTDKIFVEKLKGQRTALNNQVSSFVQGVKNNPRSIEETFTSSSKKKYVPLVNAGATSRSFEDVEAGRKSGEYVPNQVVEFVYTNEQGKPTKAYAVVTTVGLMGKPPEY